MTISLPHKFYSQICNLKNNIKTKQGEMHEDVYVCIIYNSKKLETVYVSKKKVG